MQTALRARHDLHLLRKLWHTSTGCFGFAVVVGLNLNLHHAGFALMLFALAGFLFEGIRLNSPKINERVINAMGPLMRTSEQHGCSGLPFYALGVGASLLLYERDIALLAILFLVFADPISSLFGIMFGRNKLIAGKSLEGSMAGFITCYLLAFTWITSQYQVTGIEVMAFCILAGFVGAISELLSIFADDNLLIPILSGAGLTAINAIIPLMI